MERFTLFVTLFGVAVLIGMFVALYDMRDGGRSPGFAVSELQPREMGAPQLPGGAIGFVVRDFSSRL